MFFSLGNYFTHNDYFMNNKHVGWIWEKGKHNKMIFYERQKRQDCAYCWWDLINQKIWLMTQTPVLNSLANIISPKRDSMTQFQSLGPSKLS